jgi:hypothetical protein
MAKYRKKPVVIEARQLTVMNGLEVSRWCGGAMKHEAKPSDSTDVRYWLLIPTLEGAMEADIGDWVIKGVEGEFYPCKPSVFEATYELAEL